jgi:hypothetical protein
MPLPNDVLSWPSPEALAPRNHAVSLRPVDCAFLAKGERRNRSAMGSQRNRLLPRKGGGIEGARRMLAAGRAQFRLKSRHHPATATNLVLDIPGAGPGWVVLSADLDGHSLAESTLDHGTGVAALLSMACTAASLVGGLSRGLRVCVFGAEEWSLSGSRSWLAGLPREEVGAMAMNLNRDSIAGSPHLTALTSGYPALGGFVRDAATTTGHELAVHLPISVSSDHANVAADGVPAMRLIAGFDEPESRLSYLLTAADTRDAVPPQELARATQLAGAILWRALTASDAEVATLREGAQGLEAAMAVLAPLPDSGVLVPRGGSKRQRPASFGAGER